MNLFEWSKEDLLSELKPRELRACEKVGAEFTVRTLNDQEKRLYGLRLRGKDQACLIGVHWTTNQRRWLFWRKTTGHYVGLVGTRKYATDTCKLGAPRFFLSYADVQEGNWSQVIIAFRQHSEEFKSELHAIAAFHKLLLQRVEGA